MVFRRRIGYRTFYARGVIGECLTGYYLGLTGVLSGGQPCMQPCSAFYPKLCYLMRSTSR